MATSMSTHKQPQLICVLAFATMLTHFLGLVQPSLAANGNSNQQATESTAASTQPLWSYQVKPTNYVNAAQGAQNSPYSSGPSSLFDAFTGLNQRQGALSSSPFLSILPIILIAAGGLLLLLPMLTMMMASPFGGGAFGGGGFQNYGGYPQVGTLNKRRSLDQLTQGSHRGIIELIEHVSSTIEDLSRKYSLTSGSAASGAAQQANGQPHKRSKTLNSQVNHHQAASAASPNEVLPQAQPTAANHKLEASEISASTV